MIRVGLLGGTFNPPHDGHLRIAELAWQHLGLDQLRFVPAAQPPLKDTPGPAPELRARLLALALQGRPWTVDRSELERSGPSYTVDTLVALAEREPEAAWILLLGRDQAAAFEAWRRPERILQLASLAVAGRPGNRLDLPPLLRGRTRPAWSGAPGEVVALPSTGLALSSRALRAALAAGESPAGIPPQVLAAIRAEGMYR